MLIFSVVIFVVIQDISASFSELFPNYVPPSPFASKSGGSWPPAPMGAPPLLAVWYVVTYLGSQISISYRFRIDIGEGNINPPLGHVVDKNYSNYFLRFVISPVMRTIRYVTPGWRKDIFTYVRRKETKYSTMFSSNHQLWRTRMLIS